MLGSNHVIEGQVVPKWDGLLDEEESNDGNLVSDQDFSQRGPIDSDAKLILSKMEIIHDVPNQKKHTCDQARSQNRSRTYKLWQTLLDNQSTCDVVINRKMLTNIIKSRWKLRLQTHARDRVIDHVGEMKVQDLHGVAPNFLLSCCPSSAQLCIANGT